MTLDVRDDTFERGGIGLWTEADAVTYFDDLKVVALDEEAKPETDDDDDDDD